jgi:NADH-quinone oxidoreductase subunit A
MPETPQELYFPVLVQIVIAVAVAAGMIGLSSILGRKVRNVIKDMPYESGIAPTGTARDRFSVKFYLVAMLFILFDIEAIFLFPWVVVYRDLGLYGFIIMFLFIDLVLWGLYYIYKKGVLDWALERPGSKTVA